MDKDVFVRVLEAFESETQESEFVIRDLDSFFMWSSLGLMAILYSLTLIVQIFHKDFLSPEVWQPIHIIFAATFLGHLLLIEFGERLKGHLRVSAEILIGLNIVVMALSIFVFGALHSFFIFVILSAVALSGATSGLASGLRMGLWSSFVLHAVLAVGPHFSPERMVIPFFIHNVSIFSVAVLSGILGDQLRTASREIRSQGAHILALKNINELIVENIPSALLVLDRDFIISKANRGAARTLGANDLEGQPLNEVLPEVYAELHDFVKKPLPEKNISRAEVEWSSAGNKKILEAIFSKLPVPGERAPQYLCLLQNLTEIKGLEQAMHQKEKLAAVGQLAAGIAHEIRNPLASISGSVQLLQASLKAQTSEDKKLLAIVVREIDRLNNLISEFLDYVRPAARAEDPIEINSVVREVLGLIKTHTGLPQTVLQNTQLKSQNVIYGHYDKMKQALLNIVINSYQAMVDTLRPELQVTTYDAENQVVLVIQDNGVGISKENLKRIFEPFHTTKPNGTGLGLAITQKILESHGARVVVESQLGHGTKFSIIFEADTPPEAGNMYLKKQA